MPQRSKGLMDVVRELLVVAVLVVLGPAAIAQAAPTVEPPFDQDYMLINLGPVDGVHLPYGGLAFVPGDPNGIVIVGYTGAETATLFTAGLTRDSTGSISGFAGTAVPAVSAYAAGSGMAYGPENVLFYSRVTSQMGEVKPGSSTTDKVVDLRSLFWGISGLNFVPPGLGGAGALKAMTSPYGEWWTLPIARDQNGTYDVIGQSKGPSLQGNPAGFAYVAPDMPGPMDPGLLVCEHEQSYGVGKVAMYDVDSNGDPVVSTRRVVVSGLDVPEGIAIDPPTGDVLFVSYQGWLYLLRNAPLPPTTTTIPTTTTVPTTTTTSSTKAPTTTTTAHPTTTSSSTTTAPPTTSSSTTLQPTTTTAHPTTSTTASTSTTTPTTIQPTTSTMARPTTTSTSSTTTTSSPTPSSSSTTTTTLPSSCGVDRGFDWIGCRVDALLALVQASTELGPLQATFVAKLEQARATLADGVESCAGGERTLARRALDRLARQMVLVRARTRTLRARKTIPRPLAELIGDEARGIAADARALRSALVCP